jgi:transcriptional regulator with AAA-type ATPase domain/tetratricopeptide (TPR) repeat protein
MTFMDEMLGRSHAIEVLKQQVQQVLVLGHGGHRLPPILLQGETGAGKGLLARLLHRHGPRRDGPFIDVSCAAIPDNLLEAELFGFERGAFTDARQAKAGLLQAAHKGTIFLDELALLPETSQAKLLKAIEERAVRRLGSTRTETVDVQIIAASNEGLAAAVRSRRFRADLYHRLAVVTFTLPSLRERPDDIIVLAEHFLSRACVDYGLLPPKRFAPDARTALTRYPWPGNVRELSNVVERAVLLADNSTITAQMLRLPVRNAADVGWSRFDDRLGDLEREQLFGALHDAKGNISHAAASLGMSRSRLRYRLEKHRIYPNRELHSRGQPNARRREMVGAQTNVVEYSTSTNERNANCERQHVALLRVELVAQSTTSAAPRDSTSMFSVVIDKIQIFGGRVRKIAATTIVGTFGLESADNATISAALAALAINKSSQRLQGLDPDSPAVKIAVHSAALLVDRINGSTNIKQDDEAAVELDLAELGGQSQAHFVLVSTTAAPFLERRFELARHQSVAGPLCWLKGPERTGFGIGGRTLTRFIGRQRELAIVWDQLAHAEQMFGQIIAVVGAAGIGKSRFIHEMTQAERIHGWRVLSCRADSYGIGTPSLPIVDMLKQYFAIEDRDEIESLRQKVTDKLIALGSQFESLGSPLLSILDVPVKDSQWQRLEPAQRRRRTIEACKSVIFRESREQPLLIVFEDLHWVDNETQTFLDSLIDSLPTARLLVVISYRPEYQHHWTAKTYYTQLRIDPLSRESSSAMLQTLLGDDSSLHSVQGLLIDRTEGNPLFLEESARALVETGVLHGNSGAYRLTAPPSSVVVPATIQVILGARINRLTPEDKYLLRAAAVIGKDVSYALLQAVLEVPEEILHERLARLRSAEFLYEKSLFPDLEYTFKHALTYEVAYEGVPIEQRKLLHTRILALIENIYQDRLTEQIERLAYHALNGEVWDQALSYLRQASEKAIRRSANREAWSQIEQAIGVLGHLPQNEANLQQGVDLRLAARTCLSPIGEFARVLELGREAVPLARSLRDPRRETLSYGAVSISASHMSRLTEAAEHAGRAVEIAESLRDPALRIAARHCLGLPEMFRGDFRAAINCYQRDVGLDSKQIYDQVVQPWGTGVAQEGFTRVSYAFSQSNAALCFAELGEFESALLHATQGVQVAQSLDMVYLRAITEASLGAVHLRKGNLEHAAQLAQRWLQTYTDTDLPFLQLAMTWCGGEVLSASGQLDDAISLCERAWRFAEAKSIFAFAPQVLAILGDAYGRVGRIDEALATGKQALDLANDLGQRGDEARARFMLANVQTYGSRANADRACESYQKALGLAQELGMRPLEAQCHFALSTNGGQKRGSGEQFETAMTMFRTMGMEFWSENRAQ